MGGFDWRKANLWPSFNQAQGYGKDERAIDQALAPGKLKLGFPSSCQGNKRPVGPAETWPYAVAIRSSFASRHRPSVTLRAASAAKYSQIPGTSTSSACCICASGAFMPARADSWRQRFIKVAQRRSAPPSGNSTTTLITLQRRNEYAQGAGGCTPIISKCCDVA